MDLKNYLKKYAHLLDINQHEFFTKPEYSELAFSDKKAIVKMLLSAGINLDIQKIFPYEKKFLLGNIENPNYLNASNWKRDVLDQIPFILFEVPLKQSEKEINLKSLREYLTDPNNGLRQLSVNGYKHNNDLATLDSAEIVFYHGLDDVSIDVRFEDAKGRDFFVLTDYDDKTIKDNVLILPGIGVGINESKIKNYMSSTLINSVQIALGLYLMAK